jgi:hypothetical protein
MLQIISLDVKKVVQLLSAAICITIQTNGSVDQQNGDNIFVMWYVLKECSGKISHVFTRVVCHLRYQMGLQQIVIVPILEVQADSTSFSRVMLHMVK